LARISHDQKEQALAGMRLLGTKKAGALAAGLSIEDLNAELKKSAVFRKRATEALTSGKSNLADNALEVITNYALNPPPKTDRNQLTAAIALANAFIPGFRGATTVHKKIDYDGRVTTAVPRPNYELAAPKVISVEAPKMKTIKTAIKDDKGNLIGVKSETVEDVIEGEVVNGQNLN